MRTESHFDAESDNMATPPEKRRRMDVSPGDTLGPTLREILDRKGGISNAKFLTRFLQLMYQERGLKHRITLLTVLQLTEAYLINELVNEGLVQILAQWMDDVLQIDNPTGTPLLRTLLEVLCIVDPALMISNEASFKHKLFLLIDHCDDTIKEISQQLFSLYTDEVVEGTETDTQSPSEKIAESRDEVMCVTPDGDSRVSKADEFNTLTFDAVVPKRTEKWPSLLGNANNKDEERQMPVRVEGLNTPLPRAFGKEGVLPIVSSTPRRRVAKTPKRVHWAPETSLTTIRLFEETDPPGPFKTSPPTNDSASTSLKMESQVVWSNPCTIRLDASWKVCFGEYSHEVRIQTEREEEVMAVDPSRIIGDNDPDEPYAEDTQADPHHYPALLPLDKPDKEDCKTPKKNVEIGCVTPTLQQQLNPLVGQTRTSLLSAQTYMMAPVFQTGIALMPQQQQQQQPFYFVPTHPQLQNSAPNATIIDHRNAMFRSHP